MDRHSAGHLLWLVEQRAVVASVPHYAAATARALTLHRVWRLLSRSRVNSGGMLHCCMLHSLCSLHEQLHNISARDTAAIRLTCSKHSPADGSRPAVLMHHLLCNALLGDNFVLAIVLN